VPFLSESSNNKQNNKEFEDKFHFQRCLYKFHNWKSRSIMKNG